MICFAIAYLTGLATIPLVWLVMRVARELPLALRQARHERETGTLRKRSLLKPWVWHLLVGVPRWAQWHWLAVKSVVGR